MRAPLNGIRVLELTTMITGPLAGQLLSDLGALVIKAENREGGDPFRNHHGGLYGGHFLSYNRNKRSLTLDLRAPMGKEIFFTLVERSDVLIDNFRPGVLDRLGFGSDALAARNRLFHSFYRTHNFRRNSDEGRAKMLEDLDRKHETILEAYKAVVRPSGIDLDKLTNVPMPTTHVKI